MNKLLLLCVMCVAFVFQPIHSEASAGSVTGYQKITWGLSTGRYYVNGTHAFCCQYVKSWPPVGTSIKSIEPCTNEVIRKALYYGYNGPKNTLGTDARAHVLTAIAISDANIGERETGVKAKYDEFYWDIVNNPEKYPTPPDNFKAYLAITSPDDVQNLAFYQVEAIPEKPPVEQPEEPPEEPKKVYELELLKYRTGTETPIAGTVFEHTDPDGNKSRVTTDDNGKIKITDLQYGKHTIREVEPAEGYELNGQEYSFTVDETSEEIIYLTIYNEPLPYNAIIRKTDHYGNLLSGAEFSLYSDAECQNEVKKGITDENGILQFENLVVGEKYYLKETKAPAGYKASEQIYEISEQNIPAEDVTIEVINEVGYVLPNTGSNSALLIKLAGAAMCIISLKSKKRRNTI